MGEAGIFKFSLKTEEAGSTVVGEVCLQISLLFVIDCMHAKAVHVTRGGATRVDLCLPQIT